MQPPTPFGLPPAAQRRVSRRFATRPALCSKVQPPTPFGLPPAAQRRVSRRFATRPALCSKVQPPTPFGPPAARRRVNRRLAAFPFASRAMSEEATETLDWAGYQADSTRVKHES